MSSGTPTNRPKFSPENVYIPTWDRDRNPFRDNDYVCVTEWIDGLATCVTYSKGDLFVGGPDGWRPEDEGDPRWRAVRAVPEIEIYCRERYDSILYGVTFGSVGRLWYGASSDEAWFTAFGVTSPYGWGWFDQTDFLGDAVAWRVPFVPVLWSGQFRYCNLESLAYGESYQNLGVNVKKGGIISRLYPEFSGQLDKKPLRFKLVSPDYAHHFDGNY